MLGEILEREKLSPVEMELTVPYVDHTRKDIPFIDFMIPLNPPVMVSTVYAECTALLSKRNHHMCLVKLANMFEIYGTEIFAVDKVTGEMYTVIDGTMSKIDLQAYLEDEMEDTQGVIGFAPTNTSTPKDVEMPGRIPSQSGKPSELSAIEEQSEVTVSVQKTSLWVVLHAVGSAFIISAVSGTVVVGNIQSWGLY